MGEHSLQSLDEVNGSISPRLESMSPNRKGRRYANLLIPSSSKRTATRSWRRSDDDPAITTTSGYILDQNRTTPFCPRIDYQGRADRSRHPRSMTDNREIVPSLLQDDSDEVRKPSRRVEGASSCCERGTGSVDFCESGEKNERFGDEIK